MASRFVAIGVTQGDAFFLERDRFAVLADGGRSRDGFPQLFLQSTGKNSVDVLVCTHNDADHANGLIGFLQAGFSAHEVWLPASWSDRLQDLMRWPGEFVWELARDVEEFPELPNLGEASGSLLRSVGDTYARSVSPEQGPPDYQPEDRGRTLNELIARAIETGPGYEEEVPFEPQRWLDWETWVGELWVRRWQRYVHRFRSPAHARLFLEALAAGERIRQIVLEAFHRGYDIRWFEFDPCATMTTLEPLTPLNARHVSFIRPRKWSALMYLALTTSNKQSLVFLSPGSESEPAVLFTADSDLDFAAPIVWSAGMIVTAPHHGSEANGRAYQRFWREAAEKLPVVWVRSDGRFSNRPGPSYLRLPNRYCTLCRGAAWPKQTLRFVGRGGSWIAVAGTRECSCV